MTAPLDLPALEAIANAATQGDWHWDDRNDDIRIRGGNIFSSVISGGSVGYQNAMLGIDSADAAHVVAFQPTTAKALIARIRQLESALAEACDIANKAESQFGALATERRMMRTAELRKLVTP